MTAVEVVPQQPAAKESVDVFAIPRKSRLFCGCCTLFLLPLLVVPLAAKSVSQLRNAAHGQTEAGSKVLHLALPPVCHMDPASSTDTYSMSLIGNVYEGLLAYHYLERPMKLVPNLAAAMPTISPDGCTYTVALQQGLFFHDDPCFPNGRGREVVAEDVVYSFKRIAHTGPEAAHFVRLWKLLEGFEAFANQLQRRSALFNQLPLPGVKAIDRYTVQFTLTQSFPLFLHYLAMPFASVVAREAVEHYGKDFPYHPVGTGPFVLSCFNPQAEEIIFRRNPGFRVKLFPKEATQELSHCLTSAGKKLPLLDQLVYHAPQGYRCKERLFYERRLGILEKEMLTPEERKGIAELLASPDSLQWLKNNRIMPLQQAHDGLSFLAFNAFTLPLISKKVRQAIALAFDGWLCNKRFYNGCGVVPHSYLLPGFAGHDAALVNPYVAWDPARAKELLLEAGFPDEQQRFTPLRLVAGPGEFPKRIADFFAECMQQVGISIAIEQLPFAPLMERIQGGQYSLALVAWSVDFAECSSVLEVVRHPRLGGGIRLVDPAFDRLYEQAVQTVDPCERAKLFAQLDQKAIDLVPCILLPTTGNYALVHPWVKNYVVSPLLTGNMQYIDVVPHSERSLLEEGDLPEALASLRSNASAASSEETGQGGGGAEGPAVVRSTNAG